MAAESPFGGASRKRALERYFAGKELTPQNAWEHVYRLLLSVERRTRLAHIYDANHMQKGRTFHSRAVRFTKLLCDRWGIEPQDLPNHVDVMFQECVQNYLQDKAARAARAAKRALKKAASQGAWNASSDEGAEEAKSEFLMELADLLTERLGDADATTLSDLAVEIERRAEHHFNIDRKRQNVRGEGFEDTLEWMLTRAAGLLPEQVRIRQRLSSLPGFRREIVTKGPKDAIPEPDVAITTPDGQVTLWIVTAKWSLRQDRIGTFGQEFAHYRENKLQQAAVEFVAITNEMDIARLRNVLAPGEGAGGYHFHRVYHVNCDLLAQTQEDRFVLQAFRDAKRLFSLDDFLLHAAAQTSPAALSPRTPQRG